MFGDRLSWPDSDCGRWSGGGKGNVLLCVIPMVVLYGVWCSVCSEGLLLLCRLYLLLAVLLLWGRASGVGGKRERKGGEV